MWCSSLSQSSPYIGCFELKLQREWCSYQRTAAGITCRSTGGGLVIHPDFHAMADQQAQQRPVMVGSMFLRMQPAIYSKQFWLWRSERDVVKLDFAYSVMIVCRVASSACVSTATSWCLLLLLAPAMLQLGMITWRRSQYNAVRLGLVCWLRITWLCFKFFGSKGIQTSAPALAAAAAAGKGELPVPHLHASCSTALVASPAHAAVLFAAVSQLLDLAAQPLLQVIPFLLQLPFQALGMAALLYNFHAVAFSHVDALPGLGALLHSTHAVLNGIFHVATGFVFLTPDVLANCRPGDLRVVSNFIAVYVGLVLPMFLTYKTELMRKACFVLLFVRGQTANNSVHVGSSGSSNSSSRREATNAAAAAAAVNSQLARNNNWAASSLETLQQVGPVQLISQDYVVEMLHSPTMRLKDDIICSVLLLIITWGVCLWATPKGL